MDTLDHAVTDRVVRAYAAALYHGLLDVSSLHGRLPELYEDAASYPLDEVPPTALLAAVTKRLRDHAGATRELIIELEEVKLSLRGGYDRPPHWQPQLSAENGWHDDAWDI